MKIIYNRFIPFKGFRYMNLFGVLFARRGTSPLTPVEENHEKIHTAQIKDCLYVFYYPLYLIMWLVELIRPPYNSAYRDTWFERESYLNQDDFGYLQKRRPWSFVKYWNHWRRKDDDRRIFYSPQYKVLLEAEFITDSKVYVLENSVLHIKEPTVTDTFTYTVIPMDEIRPATTTEQRYYDTQM